ncbi:pPIWI_RE module domain-containing protein [Kribbella endophytica]
MAYQTVHTAAFVPRSADESVEAEYATLAFPAAWHEPILDLYRYAKSAAVQEKLRRIPIRRLNSVLRAVAPDLLTVDDSASFSAAAPWLYVGSPLPASAFAGFLNAWLWDMSPGPEAFPVFKQTIEGLRSADLSWSPKTVDLLEHSLSAGGTNRPADASYHLLPDFIADRIAKLAPYEHLGERVEFRRVAGSARGSGAELMSWPPLEEHRKDKTGGRRTWRYSAVIRISLRTVPFSQVPRVHVAFGIRRWVSRTAWLPRGSSASVYLLPDSPLHSGLTESNRFAVGAVEWNRGLGRVAWRYGGPEGMLKHLSVIENLPPAELLVKDADPWLVGKDGLIAAIVHHTRMGAHAIGAGLMPSERRRLAEWVAPALEPEFVMAPELRRSKDVPELPHRQLEPIKPVSAKLADEQQAEIKAINDQRTINNARRVRASVSEAVDGRQLSVLVLHQGGALGDQLTGVVEATLDLTEHRVASEPTLSRWQAPDLTLELHFAELGSLGAPLGADPQPRTRTEHSEAFSARRREVTAWISGVGEQRGINPSFALIELEGADKFGPLTDPKFALRAGCAEAGVVTQFVELKSPPTKDAEFRIAAAWSDGLRQTGSRLIPEHSLGDAIPDNLNQVALWLVRRRHDGPTYTPQFTPIAVLLRPQERQVLGRTADMDEWVPYSRLLASLVGTMRPQDLRSRDQQTEAVAVFVRKLLYGLKGQPTLVLTRAQNLRPRWPWLLNGGMVPDHLQLGNGPLQRLALHGRNLRVVRVADQQRDETPQWWAPKENGGGGISKGLWAPAEESGHSGRVFYSTTDKASTHSGVGVDLSKLTHHLDSKGKPRINPGTAGWTPQLLELTMAGLQPGDDPATWAMFVHQQRTAEDYRDQLGLPLALHLARLTEQYALPYDAEETEAVEASIDELDSDLPSQGDE